MTNKNLLGYLCTALFLLWSSSAQSQETDELLSIYELIHLDQYRVMHDNEGKTVVFIDEEWKHFEDFSFVESAVFIPNPNYVDTFDFTPEQFPNLKSAQFRDLYFNQLVGISKFKNLQYLDLGFMYSPQTMRYSYVIRFPEEFWSLKNLQFLYVCNSQLTDISEKIQQLESLKILHITAHHGDDTDQLILPWNLLLMPEFSFLMVDFNQNQEELDLFKAHAHFTVTDEQYSSVTSRLKPDKDVQEIFQKEATYAKVGNKIVLKNDSLKLTIHLSKDHTSFDGTAILANNGKVIQKRKYAAGLGHGRWRIRNNAGKQRRKYSHGIPVGRWNSRNPSDHLRNQHTRYKKSTPDLRIKGRISNSPVYYINFNHMFHFDEMEKMLELDAQ